MAPDFVGRMKAEQAELKGKIDRLFLFVGSPKFDQLPEVEKVLLQEQHHAMIHYHHLLGQRLDIYTGREPAWKRRARDFVKCVDPKCSINVSYARRGVYPGSNDYNPHCHPVFEARP